MLSISSMLPVLLAGIAVLMTGILVTREPRQSLRSAFIESLAWGGGFFVAFSIEILAFSTI